MVFYDSGSTTTFIRREFLTLTSLIPLQVTVGGGSVIGVSGFGYCEVSNDTGKKLKIFAYTGDDIIPSGMDIMLGNDALDQLGPVHGRPKSTIGFGPGSDIRKLPWMSFADRTTLGSDEGSVQAVAAWSDAQMGEYLAREPEYLQPKRFSYEDVKIAPDLSPEMREQVVECLRRHASVFDTADYPDANKQYERRFGAIEVYTHLRKDWKPVHVGRVTYAPNHSLYLDKLRRRLLACGLLRLNNESPWAMRITVATKGDRSPRVCLDLRPLNAQRLASKPDIPNGLQMLCDLSTKGRRIAGDVLSAFWQYPIAESSQEVFTFWLPCLVSPGRYESRKYSFTRLVFGWSDSPGFLASHMMDLGQTARGCQGILPRVL